MSGYTVIAVCMGLMILETTVDFVPHVSGDGAAAARLRPDTVLGAVAQVAEILSSGQPWGQAIGEALRVLGLATGVSRVNLFEVARGPAGQWLAGLRHAWCAEGVAPQIGLPELQNIDLAAEGYARWIERLKAGAAVVGDVEDLPPAEQPPLALHGTRSLLVAPVFAGERWWGFLGFDACAAPRSWAQVEVDVLHIAARIIGGAIHHQEHETLLRMSQKMEALGRLAGGIAHDFNNLLFVVSAELEGLRLGLEARGPLEPAQAESFDLLAQVLEQSSGFNRRLLEFSRNREGRPVRTTLGAVLGQAARVLRQAAGPTVRLVLPALAADPPVVVDPVQVEQVLLNLVVNARDAMPRGGVLTLAIEAPAPGEAEAAADGVGGGAWARLRVTDTGEGIPAAVIDRIFEPFFTTKSATNGTGLGLSTSFSILQAAGGCIRVSSAPGVGTTFRVYLPVAPG